MARPVAYDLPCAGEWGVYLRGEWLAFPSWDDLAEYLLPYLGNVADLDQTFRLMDGNGAVLRRTAYELCPALFD